MSRYLRERMLSNVLMVVYLDPQFELGVWADFGLCIWAVLFRWCCTGILRKPGKTCDFNPSGASGQELSSGIPTSTLIKSKVGSGSMCCAHCASLSAPLTLDGKAEALRGGPLSRATQHVSGEVGLILGCAVNHNPLQPELKASRGLSFCFWSVWNVGF